MLLNLRRSLQQLEKEAKKKHLQVEALRRMCLKKRHHHRN